jgi:hypothetical protein
MAPQITNATVAFHNLQSFILNSHTTNDGNDGSILDLKDLEEMLEKAHARNLDDHNLNPEFLDTWYITVDNFENSKFSMAYTILAANDGIKYEFLQGEELPKNIAIKKVNGVDTISLKNVAKLNKSARNYTAKRYSADQKAALTAFAKEDAMPEPGKSKIVKGMDGTSILLACTKIENDPTYIIAKVNSFGVVQRFGKQVNAAVNRVSKTLTGSLV